MPPDGVSNTVLTEGQIIDNHAQNPVGRWVKEPSIFIGMDSSYQGKNKTALQPFEVGQTRADDGSERLTIHLLKTVVEPMNALEDIENQLIAILRSVCETHNVPMRRVAMDASVGQMVVVNAVERALGAGVYAVGFGEKHGINEAGRMAKRAKKQVSAGHLMRVSASDSRLSGEVYKDRKTELWMNAKHFVVHGHLRGMSGEIAKQLSSKEIQTAATPMQVAAKNNKGGENDSDDQTDALLVGLAMLRERFGIHPGGDTLPERERLENIGKRAKKRKILEKRFPSYATSYAGSGNYN